MGNPLVNVALHSAGAMSSPAVLTPGHEFVVVVVDGCSLANIHFVRRAMRYLSGDLAKSESGCLHVCLIVGNGEEAKWEDSRDFAPSLQRKASEAYDYFNDLTTHAALRATALLSSVPARSLVHVICISDGVPPEDTENRLCIYAICMCVAARGTSHTTLVRPPCKEEDDSRRWKLWSRTLSFHTTVRQVCDAEVDNSIAAPTIIYEPKCCWRGNLLCKALGIYGLCFEASQDDKSALQFLPAGATLETLHVVPQDYIPGYLLSRKMVRMNSEACCGADQAHKLANALRMSSQHGQQLALIVRECTPRTVQRRIFVLAANSEGLYLRSVSTLCAAGLWSSQPSGSTLCAPTQKGVFLSRIMSLPIAFVRDDDNHGLHLKCPLAAGRGTKRLRSDDGATSSELVQGCYGKFAEGINTGAYSQNTLLWLETEILGRPLEPQDTSFTHCPNGDGSCSMANEGVPQVLKRTKSKADELLLRSKKKKKQSGANNKVTGKKSSSAMLEDNMKRLKSAVSKALKTKMDKQDPRFRTACDQTFRMANIRLQGLDEDAFKHRSVATAEMNAAVFATLETLL